MANPQRLVLVDGTSLIYRAFFALPSNFSTASGLHTNAIYGFALMFRKIFAGRWPDYGAVVFDPPGKTFRDEKYPDYKAQRSPMADEMREQLPHIDRLVDVHRFPRVRVLGYEADDVIGTLTRLATEQGMEVHIISGDKDFAQLISDEVRMIDSIRDITYDPELVRKKWGVPPRQFVDLLALMGDKIDNIPGVPGIGQKGAAGLLDKYGSLAGVLEHVEELKGRQKTGLTDHRDDALLSQELATIDRKVPLEIGLEDLKLETPDAGAINELYRELEFYSLLSEEEEARAREAERQEADYRLIDSTAAAGEALEALPAGPVAVHPIFDGWTPVRGELAGLAFCAAGGQAFYVPIFGQGGLGDEVLGLCKPWFEDDAREKITHNAKQLWIALERHGIRLAGQVFDVMLASFLIDPVRIIPHRLDQLSKEFLHRTLQPAKTVVGSGKKEIEFTEAPADALTPYACHLVDAIWQMAPKVREGLEREGQLENYESVDRPLSWVLGRMEIDGIRVDEEDLDRLGQEFRDQLTEYERKIHEIAGHEFNIASPKQLSTVLFEELGLPVIKRTKSGYSTNAEVLERLAPKHEIAQLLLAQRKLAKLINTYTDVLTRERWETTGRIHTTIQQTVARSGRLITTEPDLQRTPVKTPEGKRIRKAFIPRDGWRLISADWSQIELRLLAHFTKRPPAGRGLRQGPRRPRAHGRPTVRRRSPDARSLGSSAAIGKLVNFSTIYGQGATALGQIVGVSPASRPSAYIDEYFAAYYAGVRRVARRRPSPRPTSTASSPPSSAVAATSPSCRATTGKDRQAGERIAGEHAQSRARPRTSASSPCSPSPGSCGNASWRAR